MCETCVYRQTGEAWELLSNTCRMPPMFAVGKLCLPQLFLDSFCLTAVGVTQILPTTGFRLLSTWSLHYCVCESMLLFLKLPGRDVRSSAITPSFSMFSRSKSFLPRLQVMDRFLSCLFLHWAYLESSRVGLLYFFQLPNFFLVPLSHFHFFLGVFKLFSCFKFICRYLVTFFYKPTFKSLSDNFNSAIIESMHVGYYFSNPGWYGPASLTDKCLSGMSWCSGVLCIEATI